MPESRNMTEYEQIMLAVSFNAVDGHACRPPLDVERRSLESAATYFGSKEQADVLNQRFVQAFFELAGQSYEPDSTDYVLAPTSSNALDVVAKYLERSGKTDVALVEPCFDSIPLLFGKQGLKLTPFSDSRYSDHSSLTSVRGDAICVVSPNNPTGATLDESAFRTLAQTCADEDRILILDPSFRFYIPKDKVYDQYGVLNDVGATYIVAEDTGKTWPTDELKLSILASSKDVGPALAEIASDLWLKQSAFTLQLMTSLVTASSDDDLHSLHNLIKSNRSMLKAHLEGLPINYDGMDFMSVAWLGLADMSASEFISLLKHKDPEVGVLGGEGFYWSGKHGINPGRNHIRVALARDEITIERVASSMAEALRSKNS